jgi:sugar-specific transcriptional regulator TrmB
VAGLSEETIKRVLMNSGLTEKEAEVYIFLAKHDALKGTEIAKLLGKDKAQVFHILKRLQAKGFVESTIEFPTHFSAVPFENVLESITKARQDEVAFIEKSKKELLDYLRKKHKVDLDPSSEKFVVIKGNKKIYPRISKMILDTRHTLLGATTVSGLIRADEFGIFDVALSHLLRSQIHYRFLTELSEQNLNTAKQTLKKMPKTDFNFKARNPDFGLTLFPRMVTRDDEEVLFFMAPRTGSTETDDICLWTNCKSLVQAFAVVFEDLWNNSTDIEEKIAELETGKKTAPWEKDSHKTFENFDEVIETAEEEILLMTSAEGLLESSKRIAMFRDIAKRGVSVKIMAPITNENLHAARQLSKHCTVKHVPISYLDTVIIDGKHIFQSKNQPQPKEKKQKKGSYFADAFFTNDPEYVEKTKQMLNDFWKNAPVPPVIALDSAIKPPAPEIVTISDNGYSLTRPNGPYTKMVMPIKEKQGVITEKDVLDQIINAEKYPCKNWRKKAARFYGSVGNAVIHPPESFKLPPDMIIWVQQYNSQSSFGAEDMLFLNLWLETPGGYAFVPVAAVTNNPRTVEFHKKEFEGTPAGKNIRVVRKDELQIRVHGNTFFAGWTVPIKLFPASLVLPPSCILLEGYSRLKTGIIDVNMPSGVRVHAEYNGYDAFVTFFHPASKYSGPGTDGIIGRDAVVTMHPPQATQA